MNGVSENLTPSAQQEGRREFLRFSHIFATVVREILETRYLEAVSPEPLSRSQFHLIKLIAEHGRHQVGEVAEFLGVSPSAATQSIDKLVNKGLLVRRPSTGDRRAIFLSASAKGRRLIRKHEQLKARRLEPVIDAFDSREIEQFTRLLERFSLAMIRREESGGGPCMRCAAYWDDCCPVAQLHDDCPYRKIRGARRSATSKKDKKSP